MTSRQRSCRATGIGARGEFHPCSFAWKSKDPQEGADGSQRWARSSHMDVAPASPARMRFRDDDAAMPRTSQQAERTLRRRQRTAPIAQTPTRRRSRTRERQVREAVHESNDLPSALHGARGLERPGVTTECRRGAPPVRHRLGTSRPCAQAPRARRRLAYGRRLLASAIRSVRRGKFPGGFCEKASSGRVWTSTGGQTGEPIGWQPCHLGANRGPDFRIAHLPARARQLTP